VLAPKGSMDMRIALTIALGALALADSAAHGFAAERVAKAPVVRTESTVQPTDARYYGKRAVHPRQFAGRRIGFYSYSYRDVIGRYRDPYLDRQTQAGPFDYGFFFDSGITPRGGDSPYMR
jgi:hypothetical protein